MSQIDFYFDFSCPWSYLALVRLRDVADRNAATIEFKPVSVHHILATEAPDRQATRLSLNPAKAAWERRDLALWAKFWGLRLELHDNWPFDASAPGAAMLLARQLGGGLPYALELFAAHFAGGRNICDSGVLEEAAVNVGLDRAKFRAGLQNALWLEQIAANSGELIRRGGFGTPSMFVGDELFFGNDRVPLVEWTLGPVSDAEFVIPGQHGKI